MNREFQKIMEIEKKLMETRDQLCNEVCQAIGRDVEGAVMPGVKVSSRDIRAAIVSFSAIANSKVLSLSPHYYIPKSQSELVTTALTASARSNGASGLHDKLAEMVESQKVTVKEASYQLNPYTVSVLKSALAEM